MCNCNNKIHFVQSVNVTDANVVLTVSKSTNISSLDCFELIVCKNVGENVTGAPLPVQIIVNGTAIALLNKYSLPILSDKLPCRKKYFGAYVAEGTATPYIILFNTPCCKCNA